MPSLFDDIYRYLEEKGIDAYEYLNDPERAESLRASLPMVAGFTEMEQAARQVFPNARFEQGGQNLYEERLMDKAANEMEGKFSKREFRANEGTGRTQRPETLNLESEKAEKLNRWRQHNAPSQRIRGVESDFSVGGKGRVNPNTPLGGAKASGPYGWGTAIPLGLAFGEAIRQIPGWDEYMESKGASLYDLLSPSNANETSLKDAIQAGLAVPTMGGVEQTKANPAEQKILNEIKGMKDLKKEADRVLSANDTSKPVPYPTESEARAKIKGLEPGESVRDYVDRVNIRSNSNMFPREDSSLAKVSDDEMEKFNIELGKMLDYAKRHVSDKFGVDIDTYDPAREAWYNTYLQTRPGMTQQQYNHLYERNLAEASNKRDKALSLLNGVVNMFKTHMGTERQRKEEFARRMEEKEKDRTIRATTAAEKEANARKEKSGEIKKALDAHYFQFTNPIDTEGKKGNVSDTPANLDDDMRNEYYQAQEEAERLMNENRKMTSAQAYRQALSKVGAKRGAAIQRVDLARNFLKPFINDESRLQERKDRLTKEYGYSQQEVDKALSTINQAPQTGGQPTNVKKPNYKIVSVQ